MTLVFRHYLVSNKFVELRRLVLQNNFLLPNKNENVRKNNRNKKRKLTQKEHKNKIISKCAITIYAGVSEVCCWLQLTDNNLEHLCVCVRVCLKLLCVHKQSAKAGIVIVNLFCQQQIFVLPVLPKCLMCAASISGICVASAQRAMNRNLISFLPRVAPKISVSRLPNACQCKWVFMRTIQSNRII